MKRPEWDEFWFVIAAFYSTRGTCPRLHTATVLVDKNNRMVSAGYNGSIPEMPHCDEAGCLIIEGHCARTFHGEENAIDNAVDLRRLEGATAYTIGTPCLRCFKRLVKNGVQRILYTGAHENYRDEADRLNAEKSIDEIIHAKKIEFRRVDLDLRTLIYKMMKRLEEPGGILWPPSC